MWNSRNQLDQGSSIVAPLGIVRSAGKFALWSVLGSLIGIGVVVAIPIVAIVIVYKLNLKGSGLLFLMGLMLVLVASAVWILGRCLSQVIRRLIGTTSKPETSPFLTYATAVLAIVCM